MNLLDGMKIKNYKTNTKGSKYYSNTYDSNLDVFTMLSRYNPTDEIIQKFENALQEDKTLALANLLYILDIRNGKGERLIFKTIYKYLCNNYPEEALKILPHIKELGRYDYILEGINTKIEEQTMNIIKTQLKEDINSETPSLLAKWLPSHRTHNENNNLAKIIRKKLNMTEKTYRKTLSELRKKLNIVEKNLSTKKYDRIDFSKVPTKAMLKYTEAYNRHMKEQYEKYKENVNKGETKINTTGLFAYEIVKKILWGMPCDEELYDLMWKNQKNIFENQDANILVVADTSGSMTNYNGIPYATSVGLALYTAERNKGIFKNHFITFSENPILQEVKGTTIKQKIDNIESIVANTDIDKVFELILTTAIENKLKQKDIPSHIIIISDMEFDQGVYTKEGTNFEGWKKEFQEKNYKLPTIIFWNVAAFTQGVPTTKYENDVALISGFSINILENILTLDNYSPIDVMKEKLSPYIEMLGDN